MPTGTWERLPEARRAAIVRAAEDEFSARGFSGGSLNTIARNARVAKGSLFQYFADKVDLYAYLSELASLRIRAAMELRIRTLDWDAGFFAALTGLTLEWEAYFHDHPLERALTAAANLEPDSAALGAVRRVVNEHYLAVLGPLLRDAKDRGQLRADADLDAFLSMLLLVLPHLALAAHHPGLDPVLGLSTGRSEDRSAAVIRLVEVFRAAFGVREPSGPR
ncbi:TetR/AcrR family transcriptional regulator [Streptomyces sp. NBC_00820]|uniref:TetR/AcrR family transcriptional regulator n=1 Tax=Streptomyces sp. NBC_00820 TaxID=2975842 RepID=UPI002ED4FA93|nr:TetR/AcrR family transcriptional regulator [Streptomyces sp. NBC_00820]